MKNLFLFLFTATCLNSFCQQVVADATFNTGTGFNNSVFSTTLQPDGKIIVGGDFTLFNGVAINNIARLNSDGTLDASFNPDNGFNNNVVYSISLQPDGKIIVGGYFTLFNGVTRNCIARLNSDGTLDLSFNPGSGFNSTVASVTLQSDGKIIVGGGFYFFNGEARNRIARLNSDGTLDLSFNPGSGFNNYGLSSTTLQPDGKIVVVGDFTIFNGIVRNKIARLNSDGTLDASFKPGTGFNNGSAVSTMLQPDGKIILGGDFTLFNGEARNKIVRLNSDGTLDASFNPGIGFDDQVSSTTLQPDGKIIVAGSFTYVNGEARNIIARLNSDGTLDASFTLGFDGNGVNSTTLQPDGKIIVAGSFTYVNGVSKNNIARLYDCTLDPLPLPTIFVSGPTRFCQGGSVSLTSSNGSSYVWSTGATTLSISPTTAGSYTVEVTDANGCKKTSTATVVSVNSLPTSTIIAGGATTFCQGGSVTLTSSNGDSYLWSNGATSASISPTASGNYSVEVTDANGCKNTSAITNVTVNPLPSAFITAAGNTTFCQGGSVTLTSSNGNSYLWSNGATSASISPTNAGNYSVKVTDINGCSNTSASISVVVSDCAGLEEVESLFVKIYPNPTSDLLTISSSNYLGKYSIEIYDNTGKLVKEYSLSEQETQISVNELSEGIYTIKLIGENYSQTTKFSLVR